MTRRMNWVMASLEILSRSAESMTARQIADAAIAEGLRPRSGDFPEYSVQAAIARDQKANGDASAFITISRPGELNQYRLKGK